MEQWFTLADRIVRPLLAIMFGAAFILGSIMNYNLGEGFIGLTTAVVLWYFKARDDEKASERVDEKQKELVELAKSLPPENLDKPHDQPAEPNRIIP